MRLPSEKELETLRKEYPDGTKVVLVSMDDPQAPPIGTIGVVKGVDSMGDLLMNWETGSGLNVIHGVDVVRKV